MEFQQRDEVFCEGLLKQLEDDLLAISKDEYGEIVQARMSMEICLQYCVNLRSTQPSFQSTEQEVNFFREVKPRFTARYIFYAELYHILLNNFTISPEVEESYYRRHLQRVKIFMERYAQFYQYYKSGLNYLDHSYFTRHSDNGQTALQEFIDFDRGYSTGYDYLLAKIIAYEMLCQELNQRITRLKQSGSTDHQQQPRFVLTWTAPKVAMIELIYGLYASGVFNHSQVDLKRIAEAFSQFFNLPLNNIYKVWEEIRLRQKNRTAFLDNLRSSLLRKMDDDDLAAK
ncbi:RteC domain-containing protein [Niastella sp. OAS944]|uniref:RteC domain-containing protein n=1 Tax=Niastella sp. OAS944 TaxID=2664089 RepID=UPI003495ECAC|nr:hypothetical protein [Chitinophagaceae bacterium OAS944]